MTDADAAERQAAAMERLADEMERQNAVLLELARSVQMVAFAERLQARLQKSLYHMEKPIGVC